MNMDPSSIIIDYLQYKRSQLTIKLMSTIKLNTNYVCLGHLATKKNLPNQQPIRVSILLQRYKKYWCLSEAILKFFFSTLFITNHAHAKKEENLRFPHSPIHLLCILILTLFILTHCEKQHEIAACIINVWSFTEVLPKIKTTTTKKNLVPKTTSLFLTKLYPLVTEKVA